MIKKLVKNEHLEAEIESSAMVLIDFYADWCEPCKWLDLILEKVNIRLGDEVQIVKIDIEKAESLREKFTINSVPVLILLKNGVEKWRINGFLMEDDLVEKVQEFSRET